MGSEHRRAALPTFMVFGALGLVACGFKVDGVTTDAGGVDADAKPPSVAASCKQLHATTPSTPSGDQMIDPDGAGGDASFNVFCDMTTAGGGWTVVFFPATSNLTSAATAYTSSSPRILADAQDALIGFRDANKVVAANFATFGMPAQWRTNNPLSYTNVDVSVSASVNGGTAVPSLLRFGSASFSTDCDDPWDTASGAFGRLCLVGTLAPFFAGFSAVLQDTCTNSLAVWNTQACAADVRFSIAVR